MGLLPRTDKPAKRPTTGTSGCWVCTPGAKGGMCATHQRRVRDTAQREGRLNTSVR
jgi:hypothetical protein